MFHKFSLSTFARCVEEALLGEHKRKESITVWEEDTCGVDKRLLSAGLNAK